MWSKTIPNKYSKFKNVLFSSNLYVLQKSSACDLKAILDISSVTYKEIAQSTVFLWLYFV